VWKNLRIALLLLVLAAVAGQQLLERRATQAWKETLWVGIFPLNADGSASAQHYIASLSPADFADLEAFFAREARRYGLALETPVHIELYPQGPQLPPTLAADAGRTEAPSPPVVPSRPEPSSLARPARMKRWSCGMGIRRVITARG
jgi:hypothetical protein